LAGCSGGLRSDTQPSAAVESTRASPCVLAPTRANVEARSPSHIPAPPNAYGKRVSVWSWVYEDRQRGGRCANPSSGERERGRVAEGRTRRPQPCGRFGIGAKSVVAQGVGGDPGGGECDGGGGRAGRPASVSPDDDGAAGYVNPMSISPPPNAYGLPACGLAVFRFLRATRQAAGRRGHGPAFSARQPAPRSARRAAWDFCTRGNPTPPSFPSG